MKQVKTTHRTKSKPYPLPKSYNRPGTGRKPADHMTHCKNSKRHK